MHPVAVFLILLYNNHIIFISYNNIV